MVEKLLEFLFQNGPKIDPIKLKMEVRTQVDIKTHGLDAFI